MPLNICARYLKGGYFEEVKSEIWYYISFYSLHYFFQYSIAAYHSCYAAMLLCCTCLGLHFLFYFGVTFLFFLCLTALTSLLRAHLLNQSSPWLIVSTCYPWPRVRAVCVCIRLVMSGQVTSGVARCVDHRWEFLAMSVFAFSLLILLLRFFLHTSVSFTWERFFWGYLFIPLVHSSSISNSLFLFFSVLKYTFLFSNPESCSWALTLITAHICLCHLNKMDFLHKHIVNVWIWKKTSLINL